MKLSDEERANIRQAFGRMTLRQKLDYIWTYYKIPIVAAAATLFFVVSYGGHLLTRKPVLLYAACVNVTVGDELAQALDAGFAATLPDAPRRAVVDLSLGLYLSTDASVEDHEYAYASRMKVMAAVTDEQLDVVLMNREAYDILSASGYLLDLPDLLAQDAALAGRLAPCLTENTVVLEDNQVEFDLGTAEEYWAETRQAQNGIALSTLPLFAQAGFPDEVYLGVIGNTPRADRVLDYIRYLAAPAPAASSAEG